MGQIFGNSNHPVNLKKIKLKVWPLRNELEAILKKEIDKLEEVPASENLEIVKTLYDYYHYQLPIPSENAPAPASDEEGGNESPTESVESTFTFFNPDLEKENIGTGICLLADFLMEDICFFSTKSFIPGQSIVIDFGVTSPFSLTAEVIKCLNYNPSGRIISETRSPYRIHAKFSFSRKGERTLLREFIESIKPELPTDAKSVKVAEEEDDGDDLSDLGI